MPEFDVDAWLDTYQPRTTEVAVAVDMALVDQWRQLNEQLQAAMLAPETDQAQCIALAQSIVDLQGEIERSGKVFKLQEVSAQEWADLMRDHPPTAEQAAKQRLLDHNPDTFPAAAIAACSVEPKLTVDQAKRIRKTLGNADFHTLWEAVYLMAREVMPAPKSQLAGVVLQANNGSSVTPARKASRARPGSAAVDGRSRRTTTRKAK